MPCDCGKVPCVCENSCMCSCNDSEIVTPRVCNKLFCQEQVTMENTKIDLCTFLAKQSEKNDSQTIENTKADYTSIDSVQNTDNGQVIESVPVDTKVDEIKETKLENLLLSQVEANGTTHETLKTIGSADVADTDSKHDKIKGMSRVKREISPVVLEIIAGLDFDFDIEELEAASRCGLTDYRVFDQNIYADSKLCYSIHEVEEKTNAMTKAVCKEIIKIKRIKKQLDKHREDIEKFNEEKQKFTDISLLSKCYETNNKKMFDKLQKYSSRIKHFLNNIYKFKNINSKLKFKIEKKMNKLNAMSSKMPEITAQFQRISIDKQNLNTKCAIHSNFSKIDELNIVGKLLKISEKIQKKLIYFNDFLDKSKRELRKINQGLSKIKDLYSEEN